ncbi:MAG: transcriptional regulator NrdR [Acidimicrobiia bacterium]
MQCPQCAHPDSRVIDSRPAESGTSIRRRRVCESCAYRFSTYERAVPTLTVLKRSGRTEPFDPDKLRRGIESALADRPVPEGAVHALLVQIEVAVRSAAVPTPTEVLGRMVLERLRSLDEIASLRFASVYKDFRDVEDFERELAELEASLHTPES